MVIFPTIKTAQQVADANNVSALDEPLEERWVYKVENFENGKAAVRIYDEESNFLGYI